MKKPELGSYSQDQMMLAVICVLLISGIKAVPRDNARTTLNTNSTSARINPIRILGMVAPTENTNVFLMILKKFALLNRVT